MEQRVDQLFRLVRSQPAKLSVEMKLLRHEHEFAAGNEVAPAHLMNHSVSQTTEQPHHQPTKKARLMLRAMLP